MKEAIEQFLATVVDKKNMDLAELKRLYTEITGEPAKCDGEICVSKMIAKLKKHYHLNFGPKTKVEKARKYVLKPGNHAFAPGGPSDHNNDNTTDEQIKNYIKAYPHISKLLIPIIK